MPSLVAPGARIIWKEEWERLITKDPTRPHLICGKKGFITSPQASFFSSPRQCYEFREHAYVQAGLSAELAHPKQAPFKVLLLQRRGGHSRHITNIEQITA